MQITEKFLSIKLTRESSRHSVSAYIVPSIDDKRQLDLKQWSSKNYVYGTQDGKIVIKIFLAEHS